MLKRKKINPFPNFPFDCLVEIGKFLNIKDLNEFRLTCKEFNEVIELFKRMFFFKKPIKSLSRFIKNKKRCNIFIRKDGKDSIEDKERRIKLRLKDILKIEFFDVRILNKVKFFYFSDVYYPAEENLSLEKYFLVETHFIFIYNKLYYHYWNFNDDPVSDCTTKSVNFYKFVNGIDGKFFCG